MSSEWILLLREEGTAEDTPQGTIDYKFYCFGGEPRFLYVSQGLEDHATASISFLDLQWERMRFKRNDYCDFKKLPCKPRAFDEMVSSSKSLSKGLPFARVDFFEYKGKARFSEMTFSPCGGFMRFSPECWDEKIGSYLDIGEVNCNG